MISLTQKQTFIELIKFVIVGLTATGIHYGLYRLLLPLLSSSLAYSLGYACSFIFNFYLSASYTFKAKGTFRRLLGFAGSHLVNYSCHILLLHLFLHLGASEQLAPFPVFAVCIPLNFLLVRFVFQSSWLTQ